MIADLLPEPWAEALCRDPKWRQTHPTATTLLDEFALQWWRIGWRAVGVLNPPCYCDPKCVLSSYHTTDSHLDTWPSCLPRQQ